jgi:hypothetical protein
MHNAVIQAYKAKIDDLLKDVDYATVCAIEKSHADFTKRWAQYENRRKSRLNKLKLNPGVSEARFDSMKREEKCILDHYTLLSYHANEIKKQQARITRNRRWVVTAAAFTIITVSCGVYKVIQPDPNTVPKQEEPQRTNSPVQAKADSANLNGNTRKRGRKGEATAQSMTP